MAENQRLKKILKRTYEKIVGIVLAVAGFMCFLGGVVFLYFAVTKSLVAGDYP